MINMLKEKLINSQEILVYRCILK